MDVDVDLLERNVEEQRGNRMAVAGDEVAIGGAHRSGEQPILHRPRVDEQILLVSHAAVEGREADDACQAQAVAGAVDADAVPVELVREDCGNARGRRARLKSQHAPAVVVETEGDIAARHGQALHRIETGRIFGPSTAQELGTRRHLVEQPFDANPGARRKRRRSLPRRLAMIDGDAPAVRAPDPAFDGQPRHAGDRRQRLAAKAEAGDPVDRVARQLGGRMPLERKAHFLRPHSRAVVGNLDQLEPAGRQPDRDLRRTGVE